MKTVKFLLSLAFLSMTVSCQTVGNAPKMSFEEAREVVLSMQSVPLEPPPRKMADILGVLESSRYDAGDSLEALIQRADVPVPDRKNPGDLYQFYRARGDARYELSRFNHCRADIRKAIAYDKQANIGDGALQQRLAELEMLAGSYESALELSRAAIKTGVYQREWANDGYKVSGWRIGPFLAFQGRVHCRMGNFFRASIAIADAKAAYGKKPAWARLSGIFYGGVTDMGNENDILAAKAEILEAQGRYEQAHELRAMVLNYHYSKRKLKPLGSVHAQMALAANLMCQGRLVLAEKEAREAVMDAVRASGKQSGMTAGALQTLGEVILAKGDLQNADILSTIQIDILTRLGLSIEEDIMVRAQLFRAGVKIAEEDFSTAMIAYDLALKGMADNPYLFKRYAYSNPGLILSLLQNDRVSEADDLIRQTRRASLRFRVAATHDEAQMQALAAMVLHKNRQTAAALDRFSAAVPGLVATIQDPNSTFEKRRLADILLRAYIDMLLELYQQKDDRIYGVNVAEEIFKLADAQYSRVNSALGESNARAASLTDPELAELVRQEQDAGKKIESLQAVLFNASAASGGASGWSLTVLERSIESLIRARAAIIARIEKKFPQYSRYIHPIPSTLAQVQAQLAPEEAFVAIWTLKDRTCVWAISPEGVPAFEVIGLGEKAVESRVSTLRRALKPDVRLLNEMPEFDTATAYELYDRILKPVESVWQNATDLLVVVRGPLGQVPLAVLPTQPVALQPEVGIRFSGYRHVDWLIKTVSITRLPSAASLVTLRALPDGNPNREAFAGFGDPIFTLAQSGTRAEGNSALERHGGSGEEIAIRGIRVSELGPLDNNSIASVRMENLCRLPDTAQEISEIAKCLGADRARDVFLGKAASETRVKTEDLSKRKVLAFATHALLSGDLNGLTQPALALSSPEVTGQDEDGLLTLGEILTLKLDADLVVLSACDTGAGDGSGNEAVSGLGRAFFYSGARALLVTMWPVETTSANELTTGLFRYRKNTIGLSWAQAQQKSILELMGTRGLRDDEGALVASYAHPLFWGPFLVVGDSGAR